MTTVRLLHVEDDPLQHALVARHLSKLEEYKFDISRATGEEAAVDAFLHNPFDLVIADYSLTDGDGLSCLKRIRQVDPVVSIIALSGEATSEIAAQLVEAGADDYLGKQNLDASRLSASVRQVLLRSRAFRNRICKTEGNRQMT